MFATGPIRGITTGLAGLTAADITISNLVLTVGGNTISAQMIGGHATADGQTGSRPEVGGFSDFQGLTVNGQAITVTGAPNQQIDLTNQAKLVLNEQFPSVSDTFGTITLNALHLYGGPVVDFRLASAQAGITVNPNDGPAVPEPGTRVLLAVGMLSLFGRCWANRKALPAAVDRPDLQASQSRKIILSSRNSWI